MFVSMAKFSISAVSHDLYFAVRVKGPYCAGRKGVVVEHPQGAEMDKVLVMVITKGKMPSAVKCPIFDCTLYLINALRFPNDDHRSISPSKSL